MSAPKLRLTARWRSGRKVAPGRDALEFLTSEAARLGEDPEAVRRAIVKDTPLARMLLAHLGLTRDALAGQGRPKDIPRLLLIAAVVQDLLERGTPEADAFRAAPRYLASEKLRKRDGIAAAFAGTAHGKGPDKPNMTAEAVADAFRASRTDVPHLFFDTVADDLDTPAPPG